MLPYFLNRVNRTILILAADLTLVVFSVYLAYLLRFNFSIPDHHLVSLLWIVPVFVLIRFLGFMVFRTYAGIIRYAGIEDATKVFYCMTIGSLIILTSNFLFLEKFGQYLVPTSILVMEYIFSMFFLFVLRVVYKKIFQYLGSRGKETKIAIIYGAGEAGLITKHTLEKDVASNYKVSAFFDDNANLRKTILEGITVFGPIAALDDYLEDNPADLLIISILDLPLSKKKQVAEICLKHHVRVLTVPPMNLWINGELNFRQIRQLKIEDLLGRDAIQLDIQKIKQQINKKRILVTGGAGSIGSELVRQMLRFNPAEVLILDMAESPLHAIELELKGQNGRSNLKFRIADIRDRNTMRLVFHEFKPELVFHAAAYKHVPMMETHPREAVLNNSLASKLLADLSLESGVEKFVMISTDKAVNPTNVMGASKRIAEMYVQSLNEQVRLSDKKNTTRFITTRFGNVLGSNGSVIPFFEKQILSGGPVTVTHPEVTRFFMTIPEAAQLVLEAAAMGKGGEIFMFDMGEPVKIYDMACKMIRLSGLEPERDIPIVFTGLRPGEKLYEELLQDSEKTLPTHHDKITIAKVAPPQWEEILTRINELEDLCHKAEVLPMVKKMKQIVPEYQSMNSEFELLDQKSAN